ncbi:hypothetical protein SMC26_39645 [Actinomadura fulvescens]
MQAAEAAANAANAADTIAAVANAVDTAARAADIAAWTFTLCRSSAPL